MTTIDFNKQVKYINPNDEVEANQVFIVVNYNEVTNRVIIEWVNTDMPIRPTFLASIEDIENI
jgi:hypothetical protein